MFAALMGIIVGQASTLSCPADNPASDRVAEPFELPWLPDSIGMIPVDTIQGFPVYGSSFDEIRRATHCDVEKLLKDDMRGGLFSNEGRVFLDFHELTAGQSTLQDKVSLLRIFYDFRVPANAPIGGWTMDKMQRVMIVSTHGNTCTRRFEWRGSRKSCTASFKTIDIEGDGMYEVIIEDDRSGNGGTENRVEVLKYLGGQFRIVFEAGLNRSKGAFPYSYENSYKFVANGVRPELLDIILSISTEVDVPYSDPEYSGYLRANGLLGFKPIKQTVRYMFDGRKYTPTGKPYEYDAYFDRKRLHK